MIVLPAIGSQLIATTSLFLMPALMSTLQAKAGLSDRASGLLLSMELAVSAFTTIYLTAFPGHSTRRWATRRRALFGGALAIAGTALTLVSPSAPMLFATRLAAASLRTLPGDVADNARRAGRV